MQPITPARAGGGLKCRGAPAGRGARENVPDLRGLCRAPECASDRRWQEGSPPLKALRLTSKVFAVERWKVTGEKVAGGKVEGRRWHVELPLGASSCPSWIPGAGKGSRQAEGGALKVER